MNSRQLAVKHHNIRHVFDLIMNLCNMTPSVVFRKMKLQKSFYNYPLSKYSALYAQEKEYLVNIITLQRGVA
jgi:hypothetical protein